MHIEQAAEATPELVEAMARLVPQLSSSSPPPDAAQLQAIIDQPGTTLFMARDDDGALVGTLTLVVFPIPTGNRAWIEDVIVDQAAGGHGIGTALTNAALDQARAQGAKTVDLTSRPSREAANHLYRKVGFEQRETNVYRYTIQP